MIGQVGHYELIQPLGAGAMGRVYVARDLRDKSLHALKLLPPDFAADPARGNIAEMAFGCNDHARVTGNVLEDEKAGFHWAYGRSDHLGGTVGLAAFRSPAHVVHQDIVYAKESPISIARADLIDREGRRTAVIEGGDYRLW